MDIQAVVEYNADGCLIYAQNYTGAFVRGRTRQEAAAKFDREIRQYLYWATGRLNTHFAPCKVEIVQEKESPLQIRDADSDVLFDSERLPLTRMEYDHLKLLAMKSASDFQCLYDSVPNKSGTVLLPRKTFYGDVPRTASEMYEHTKNVNGYYFGEIGVKVANEPDIVSCRRAGFDKVEACAGFLNNGVFSGSYGEDWSLRKVCRRFIWHDRIHAKAMYRMAVRLCGERNVLNPFRLQEG